MNTAAIGTDVPYGDVRSPENLGARKMIRQIIFLILAVGTLLGLYAHFQLAPALEENARLKADNAELARVSKDLTRRVAGLPALQAELGRTKLALGTEVAEKKRLAVMYERAEAARKQAVADHAAALSRIAVLEKAAGKKPAAKRK